jgi:hypothetical protein
MKIMYIVKYESGSYDDYFVQDVFVTNNKELAEKWVNKFNSRITYWKEVIKQYNNEDGYLDRKYWAIPFVKRYRIIRDINEAFIEEIELR